jgi:hypothetical protein
MHRLTQLFINPFSFPFNYSFRVSIVRHIHPTIPLRFNHVHCIIRHYIRSKSVINCNLTNGGLLIYDHLTISSKCIRICVSKPFQPLPPCIYYITHNNVIMPWNDGSSVGSYSLPPILSMRKTFPIFLIKSWIHFDDSIRFLDLLLLSFHWFLILNVSYYSHCDLFIVGTTGGMSTNTK